jgi:hypothetical protein
MTPMPWPSHVDEWWSSVEAITGEHLPASLAYDRGLAIVKPSVSLSDASHNLLSCCINAQYLVFC